MSTTRSRTSRMFPGQILAALNDASLTAEDHVREENSSTAADEAAPVARWIADRSHILAFVFCVMGVPLALLGFVALVGSGLSGSVMGASGLLWPAHVQTFLLVAGQAACFALTLSLGGWIAVWARLGIFSAADSVRRRSRAFFGVCLRLWAVLIPLAIVSVALAQLGARGLS